MGLSLTYLSLMILFNSFFMANYLLMRALRRHMDATFRQRRNNNGSSSSNGSSTANETPSPSLEEQILQNKFLIILLGPPLALYRKVQEMIKKYESEEGDRTERDGKLDVAVAFCFGYTRKKKYESQRFPNWDPIPYRLGAITTATLIILFTIVFSDTVLNKILGLDPDSTSPMGGVCTDVDMQSKVDDITAKLLQETKLAAAIGQSHTTTKFLEALQTDTALWGKGKYNCINYAPFTKEEFRDSSTYGKEAGFYFFPGQCVAARGAALETARNQTCMEEFCNVGRIVDQDSIIAENGEITGLDELQNSIDAAMESAENLKPVCKGCPKNNWDAAGMALGSIFGAKPKVSAYVQGQDELVGAIGDIDIDDIDITAATVEFGYKNESFCGIHEVQCPDFSKYDDLTELVQDHRLAYLEKLAKPEIEPIPPVETDELQEAYYEYLKRVLGQMEFASYLYAGYTCLSLFFPSPQIVFRVNISHGIRQFLFGVGKQQFILAVLVLWWTIVYFQTFPIFTQLELYMKVLVQDPCVVRSEYAEDIGGNFATVCNSMLSTQSNWTNTYQAINNTMELIQPMTNCCTAYPYESLSNFHDKYKNNLTEFGFNKISSGACTDYDCYETIEEPPFLGNMTACENYDFVRQEIIELSDASTISWWDVWISSGVFASLLLSPVVANYGIGLAKLADPFMVCDGKYEGPPSGFNFQESEVKALMDEIRISLKISAFGRVVIWGIFMNLLLVNIILGKMEEDEEFAITVEDAVVAGFILFISIVTVFVASKADKLLSKRISIFEELDEENKGNESKGR